MSWRTVVIIGSDKLDDSLFRTDEKKCIVDASGCVIYC